MLTDARATRFMLAHFKRSVKSPAFIAAKTNPLASHCFLSICTLQIILRNITLLCLHIPRLPATPASACLHHLMLYVTLPAEQLLCACIYDYLSHHHY